jgi:hypothetical protein
MKKIRKEGDAYQKKVLSAPGKKMKGSESHNAVADDFDFHVRQRVI